jgi:hypothetical protein
VLATSNQHTNEQFSHLSSPRGKSDSIKTATHSRNRGAHLLSFFGTDDTTLRNALHLRWNIAMATLSHPTWRLTLRLNLWALTCSSPLSLPFALSLSPTHSLIHTPMLQVLWLSFRLWFHLSDRVAYHDMFAPCQNYSARTHTEPPVVRCSRDPWTTMAPFHVEVFPNHFLEAFFCFLFFFVYLTSALLSQGMGSSRCPAHDCIPMPIPIPVPDPRWHHPTIPTIAMYRMIVYLYTLFSCPAA